MSVRQSVDAMLITTVKYNRLRRRYDWMVTLRMKLGWLALYPPTEWRDACLLSIGKTLHLLS